MATVINKPGGVFLQLADGSTHHAKYGEDISNLELSGAQEQYVGRFSDGESRTSGEYAELANQAQNRAALAEGGQPNSTSSPVPGNYSELDENGAAAVVRALEAYPRAQAAIVVHERLGLGRRVVEDSATPQAQELADQYLEGLKEEVSTVVGEDDEVFDVETHSTGPRANATVEVDPSKFRTPDLKDGPLREDNESIALDLAREADESPETGPVEEPPEPDVGQSGGQPGTPPSEEQGNGDSGDEDERTLEDLRKEAADLNVEGRSQMDKDELRDAVDSARSRNDQS